MMLMPANHSSPLVHYLAGAHPGRVGWLIGPSAISKTKLRPWLEFSLDNDAYSSFSKNRPWSEEAWRSLIQYVRLTRRIPRWTLIPDVVADREETLKRWEIYSPEIIKLGWPVAFAVQDGMTPDDVPGNTDVVFIGGTTQWKWRHLELFTSRFKRVHVGRVNEIRRLWTCEDAGVESVDGTGWFREGDGGKKHDAIMRWIRGDRGHHQTQMDLTS